MYTPTLDTSVYTPALLVILIVLIGIFFMTRKSNIVYSDAPGPWAWPVMI
jgi:hypothetical protein